jgi:hypothetical protein
MIIKRTREDREMLKIDGFIPTEVPAFFGNDSWEDDLETNDYFFNEESK